MNPEDSYKTIASGAEAVLRDRSSRFIAFAWPVENEDQIKGYIDDLKKRYYDATHHCYAWRIGPQGELFRANDDGEPSGTAGKPILGQLLSAGLTNTLIVVVRYFGGTKLGVPGLINAYRESAKEVIDVCDIIEKTVDSYYKVTFSYPVMNGVMKVVKDMEPRIVSQVFDNVCEMELAVRMGKAEQMESRLNNCEGVQVEFLRSE